MKRKTKKKYVWVILTTDKVYGVMGMNNLHGDYYAFDSFGKAVKEMKQYYYPGHFYVKQLEEK